MRRTWCLGLLLALLAPALAADPAADLAAGRWEAYLGAVGAGAVEALGVAVALDGLPAGEREAWRRRLPPVGPALDGYLRLLRGEAAGLLELLRVLPGPSRDWARRAAQIDAVAAGTAAERYRVAATGLRVLAALAPAALPESLTLAVDGLRWLPAEARGGVAEVLESLARRETQPPRPEWSVRGLRQALGGGLRAGEPLDPFLAELLRRLTAPDARPALAEHLLQRRQTAAAAEVARAILAAAPGEVATVRLVASLWRRAGREQDAYALLRGAATTLPQPGRRLARGDLLRWLRAGCPTCGGAAAGQTAAAGWEQERLARQQRVEQAPADLDARLAAAEVQQVDRRFREASAGYLGVLLDAADPGTQVAAWLGLAEVDAAAAWRQVDRVPAGATAEWPVLVAQVAVLAEAYAAGAERVERRPAATPADAEELALGLACRLLAAQPAEAEAALTRTPPAVLAPLAEHLLAIARGAAPERPTTLSPLLRGEAAARVAERAAAEVWRLGARAATRAVPQQTSAAATADLWWQVHAAAVRGDATAELVALNQACLAWAASRATAAADLPVLLARTSGAFRSGQTAERVAATVSYARALIDLARERAVPRDALAPALDSLVASLRRAGLNAEAAALAAGAGR